MKKYVLYMAGFVISSQAQAQISLSDLQIVVEAFHAEYNIEIKNSKAVFYINKSPTADNPNLWWDLPTVRASYSTLIEDSIRIHYLFLLGGYARLPGMTRDGVAATLCHELAHGIGGAPYKKREGSAQVSVEAQADYFAFQSCLPRIFKRLSPTQPVQPVNAYTDQLCQTKYATNPKAFAFCTRAFQELEAERLYLQYNSKSNTVTNYDTPDMSVVDEIELLETFYPSDQCRLDTMMAGILQNPRPRCWFTDSLFQIIK